MNERPVLDEIKMPTNDREWVISYTGEVLIARSPPDVKRQEPFSAARITLLAVKRR